MARHDAVIFDLFGTLVHTVSPADYSAMLDSVADALGAPREAFQDRWRATIIERESGTLGGLELVLTGTALSAGAEPDAERTASGREAWLGAAQGWLKPREQTGQVMRAFRAAGYRVGLLSNCSAEVPPLWHQGPLSALVDAPVFSCEMGMMKPDPRIYEHVCVLLGVAPERCLFVGDGGARELTGAREAGMEAVLLRVPGEEHTWFDTNYRLDALEWRGATIADIGELIRFLA